MPPPTSDAGSPTDRNERISAALRARRARAGASKIPRRDADDAPASSQQRGFWIGQRIRPTDPTGNRPLRLRLTGPVTEDALRGAFALLQRKHEVLRISLEERDGDLTQVVHEDVDIPLTTIDAGGRDDGYREAVSAFLSTPFDLARAPLCKALLVRFAPDDHLLCLSLHHAVFDGWSETILVEDLVEAYELVASGSSETLESPAITYGDFAAWQQDRLNEGVYDDELAHWVEQLAEVPQVLDLPADRPRDPNQEWKSDRVTFTLDPSVTARVREMGAAEGATLFMVLLAAFHSMLSRYCGQDRVWVATPVAGRPRSELQSLIGCFMNMLVLSSDLRDDPSFRELVHRCRATTLEGLAHQAVPFERVVRELNPERRAGPWAFGQVLFQVRNLPAPRSASDRVLSVEVVDEDPGIGGPDLRLEVIERDGSLRCAFGYSTALFDRATIQRAASHFGVLLDAALAHSDIPTSRLPLLTAEERDEVVHGFNGLRVEAGPAAHLAFSTRASKDPDRVAIDAGVERLTYGELLRAARSVAGQLNDFGIGPGDVVAIPAERSTGSIVALLAALAVGAAYLPIDISHPESRVREVLEDARPAAVLRPPGIDWDPPGHPPERVVDVDLSFAAALDRFRSVSPTDPAYVIYTSGTTGRPKGVVVGHGALANFLSACHRAYGWVEADRVLQFHKLSFDSSVEEIFLTLAIGATVILLPERMMDSIEAFVDESDRAQVSVMSLPTGFWRELGIAVATGRTSLPESLRVLALGGEALPREALARWTAAVGDRVQIYNGYGPTETTVIATAARVDVDPPAGLLGRPLANARVLILDRHCEPVPIGVPGQICIGGPGVALGYLNRPEETGTAFVPDPFAENDDGRLYLTGDLGRWRPDGTIEFLGRIDRQLKVRGFRVEPAEIENALLAQEGVTDAAVVARSKDGDVQLAAYVAAPDALAPAEIRRRLEGKLPGYMVPAHVIVLDRLPRTERRKVDVRALPDPGSDRGEHIPPRTPLERELGRVWEEVLEVGSVGSTDDFFALGGHSLLAMRLVSAVREAVGVEVPLATIFGAARLDDFARAVAEVRDRGAGAADLGSLLSEIEALSDEAASAALDALSGEEEG